MIPDRLENAEWLQRPDTQTIFAVLDGAAGRTRAVGGIVRDSLLNRLRGDTDIDMATELLPVAVMQRAKAAGIAAYPTGIDHGTVTLRLNDTVVEVTTCARMLPPMVVTPRCVSALTGWPTRHGVISPSMLFIAAQMDAFSIH